ncbi:MAG: hypothetical protein K8S62_03595 [Candidatus Sabulitectum sp.]|nr:hypothetical protein [Candidatus Sabulitectum sp.]
MEVITVNIVLVLAMRFLEIFPGYSSMVLSHYLHPESQICAELDPLEFSESTACWAAVIHLSQAGVENIHICEVTRIEAPVSGYLVDATGQWDSGTRDDYQVFRTGVLDGEDYRDKRGEEFVFLAAGSDENGDVFLFPEPAFTRDSVAQFVYAHEFLLNRNEFFALPEQYPL